MKWYDYIILNLQDYKWFLFAVFVILLAWGSIRLFRGKDARIPTFLFAGLLVLWAIVWIVASIFYRANL